MQFKVNQLYFKKFVKMEKNIVIDFFLSFFFFFLGLPVRHIELARLGVESELQPLAYIAAITMQDPRSELHLQPAPQLKAAPDT